MTPFELGYRYGTIENSPTSPRRAEEWLSANSLPTDSGAVTEFCEGHRDGMAKDGWRLKLAKAQRG